MGLGSFPVPILYYRYRFISDFLSCNLFVC